MPVYTLENKATKERWDVTCSWEELNQKLKESPELNQVMSAPKIVSSRMGNKDLKVPDGFKDLLKNKVKKGSGKGNTVNV